MPLFAYACAGCHAHSEILIRGDEQPVCPECGSKRLEKQMSHFAPMSGSSGNDAPLPCGAQGGCSAQGSCPYS